MYYTILYTVYLILAHFVRQIPIAVNTVSRLLMMDSKCPKHVELCIKIKLRNSASCWLILYDSNTSLT